MHAPQPRMCRPKPSQDGSDIDEDVDVARERQRIMNGRATDDVLTIEGLTKVLTYLAVHCIVASAELCLHYAYIAT